MINTIINFDIQSMVDEIPSKYNRDKHRQKESFEIPTAWLDLYPKSKTPKIPNNLITSLKQAIDSNEWKSLNLFITKRGKVSEFHSKFLDIVSILVQYIPSNTPYTITSHENDMNDSITKDIELCSDSVVSDIFRVSSTSNPCSNTPYTITSHENDINDGYRALSIENILRHDYSIFETVSEKVISVLLTPYIINGKQYHILSRNENPEFTSTNCGKSRWKYKFDSFFATNRTDYNFINSNFKTYYIRVQNKKIMNMSLSRILHTEFTNWLALSRPTKAYFTQYVHSLIGTKLKGCEIISEEIRPKKTTKKENKGFIYVEDLIDNAEKYAYESCIPTAFFSNDYFRHYTPYSMSNCVMRSLMLYKGKQLDQCDVASMYPVILLQTYNKRFRRNTFEYDLIIEIINSSNPRDIFMKWCEELNIKITKDEMKVENIAYYNMKHSDAVTMKLHKMYEQKLPGFCEWLAELKTKTEAGKKGYWNHKFVSRWLEWQESKIMDKVLIQCYDANIFAMGIHDGIDVEQGKGEIVATWIKESMLENGYICNVTINKE